MDVGVKVSGQVEGDRKRGNREWKRNREEGEGRDKDGVWGKAEKGEDGGGGEVEGGEGW